MWPAAWEGQEQGGRPASFHESQPPQVLRLEARPHAAAGPYVLFKLTDLVSVSVEAGRQPVGGRSLSVGLGA